MTNEMYERICDFLRRNTVPPTSMFPKGLGVPLVIDDDLAEPQISEEPYALGLKMSRADQADLERRMHSDTEGERP